MVNASTPPPDRRRVGRGERLALGALLLLAIVLRVAWPTLTEFKFSEARLEALALELTREGRVPLIGVPSSAGFDHSPVSVYLYVPAFLFTTDPVPATIYGGLVGAAAVALCWWLARRWPGGGRLAAFLAALLLATSPWAVAFSRKIWQVTFVPVLTLAFIGFVVSALVQGRKWSLAWALATLALLVQVHPSAISLVAALVLWLLLFWRQVKILPLVVGAALGLLTAVPFFVHQVRQGWPAVAALGELPAAIYDLAAVRLAWEAITGRGIHALAGEAYSLLDLVPRLGWFFNIAGWLAVAAGLGLGWRAVMSRRSQEAERRRSARTDLILISWLVMPVLFNYRHSLELHLHFFALIAPAAYLVIGRAAQALLGDSHQRVNRVRQTAEAESESAPHGGTGGQRPMPAARALAGVLVALVCLLACGYVVALGMMGRFVADHDTPGGFGAPLGAYRSVSNQALALAEQTSAAEILIVASGSSIVVDEEPAIFDVLLRDRLGYRFVDSDQAALFPPHPAVAVVSQGAGDAAGWYEAWPAADTGQGYTLFSLDGDWPEEGLQAIPAPRLFENGIEFQGYAWRGGVTPAETSELWLLWQVLWQSPEDTHFFVHLLDSDGTMLGQQDTVGYPTAYRSKGDRVISRFDITLGAAKDGDPSRARTGLYLYPQIVNVPVIDEAGNVVADSVTIPVGQGVSE